MYRHLAVLLVSASVCLGGTSWAGDQGKGPKAKPQKQAHHVKAKEKQNHPAAGSEMRFKGLDANNDGAISRAEWRGNDVSFNQHDWNGDGMLSGDEVRPGATRPASPRRDARFDALDRNNDGVIVRAEWRADRRTFDRLDTNNDGRITAAELSRW